MQVTEKVALLAGELSIDYVGQVPGNPRLGIPSLLMNDGPQGFRSQVSTFFLSTLTETIVPNTACHRLLLGQGYPGTTTAFPCGLAVAASWDTGLARTFGAVRLNLFHMDDTVVTIPKN